MTVANKVWYTERGREHPGKVACIFPGLAYPGLEGKYATHLFDLALKVCILGHQSRYMGILIDIQESASVFAVPLQQTRLPLQQDTQFHHLVQERRRAVVAADGDVLQSRGVGALQ